MLNRARPFVEVTDVVDTLNNKIQDEDSVTNFEEQFSSLLNASMSIAVDQGRDALLLALKLLGVQQNDEVIVQNLICHVVIDAILEIGAVPVLVDNNLDDFNISLNEVRNNISARTKVIIAAHLYGIPCDIESLRYMAKKNGCFLIEDCAHCIGSKYNNKFVGTFGDLSIFSFNFDKPLSTGKGGMLVINNPKFISDGLLIKEQYRRTSYEDDLKIVYGLLLQSVLTKRENYNNKLPIDYGLKALDDCRLFHDVNHILMHNYSEEQMQSFIVKQKLGKKQSNGKYIKFPFRILHKTISNICKQDTLKKKNMNREILLINKPRAKIGILGLKTLEHINNIRNKNARYYYNSILYENNYLKPKVDKEKDPVFLRYTIINKTKCSVKHISKIAEKKGYEIGNFNWPKPISKTFPYSNILNYNNEKLSNSIYLSKNLINLPTHSEVTREDIDNIVDILYNI